METLWLYISNEIINNPETITTESDTWDTIYTLDWVSYIDSNTSLDKIYLVELA